MTEETTFATNISRIPKRCGAYLLPPHIPVEVPLSFIEGYGWDQDILIDYSGYPEMLRGRKADGSLSFDFWSPVSLVDGYGRHALDIWRGMKELGVDVALKNAGYFVDDNYLPQRLRNEVLQNRRVPPARLSLAMTVPYDPSLWKNESLIKAGITQFETDHFPERHVVAVNHLHHLIVTSSFQPQMMRKSGVEIPISVLTPGIDTEFFQYQERPRDGQFKVLLLGALTGRKNPIGAMRMFVAASQGDHRWRMTIKTRLADGVKEVAKIAREDYRITVLIEDTPPERVRDYYYSHDCFLWPSKGEGVGLPPLEAMATGMEVVCSDNSGMSDYLTSKNSWRIRTAGKESASGPGRFSSVYCETYGDVGNWWLPDEADGVKQLRKCYEEWNEGRGRGRAAAEYVRANHNLRKQSQSVLSVLDRLI